MKNITLSADERLIAAARRRAAAERTTLNEQFRHWLERYARPDRETARAMETVGSLQARLRTGGTRFDRDEMNER